MLLELPILAAIVLCVAGIIILTVLILVFGWLNARKSKINSRPGFPVDISPNNSAVPQGEK